MKILVAEPLAPAALDLLRAQKDWDLVVADPKSYSEHLADCDALVVRSAVKVTKEVLAKAPKLRVIGRAGVGVDNVDLPAATEAGVLVMNTPGGNAVSVAEHTLALMLSMRPRFRLVTVLLRMPNPPVTTLIGPRSVTVIWVPMMPPSPLMLMEPSS